MAARRPKIFAAIAGVLLALVALAALVARFAPGSGAASPIGGAFALVDDRGAAVTERDLLGKPSLIFFGYTFCPEICPTTLNDLARWMRKLGPDADRFNYVFITLDPERDSMAAMHDYVGSFDPRIRGLTGAPEQVAAAAKDFRVYYRKNPNPKGGYELDHSAFIYLLDARGKFLGLIPYGESDEAALAKLRAALGPGGSYTIGP